MRHFSIALLLVGAVLSAAPARAQLGGLLDRARDAAERTVGQATERSADEAASTAGDAARNAGPERQEAIALARRLMEVYHQYRDQLVDFDASYAADGVTEEDLARVEAAEATFPEMQAAMLPIYERWGEGEHEEPWHTISNAYREMEIDPSEYMEVTATFEGDVDYAFREMAQAIDEAAVYRREMAEGEVAMLRWHINDIRSEDNLTDVHLERAQQVRATTDLALRYDPANENLNAIRAETAELLAETEGALRDQIASTAWPGHAAGAPSRHAGAALAFLRADDRWGGRDDGYEVLAVAVRGDWQPAKHNIFGQVVQWRLPVVVAATKPAWRDGLGAARMYELSMLAEERLPAPQAPPFVGYWVGDNRFLALDRVPRQ